MTVYIDLEAYKHYDAHRDHFWRSGKLLHQILLTQKKVTLINRSFVSVTRANFLNVISLGTSFHTV